MQITGILSDESIAAYWAQLNTEVFYVMGKMSHVDKAWAMDGVPAVLKACEELGARLSSDDVLEAASSRKRLLHQDDIGMVLEVISNLQSARGIRIFRWLEQYQPEFSAELIEAATQMSDNQSAQLFLERMRVLNKLHLISRIFSYNRLRMIIDRLSEMKSDGTMARLITENANAKKADAEQEVDDLTRDLSHYIHDEAVSETISDDTDKRDGDEW